MKFFACANCSQAIFFEDIVCNSCGYLLGFDTEKRELLALTRTENNGLVISKKKATATYKYCANHEHVACNWLIAIDSDATFCRACDLNEVIPNLSSPQNIAQWKKIEVAKRRLIYELLQMQLPIIKKTSEQPQGLAFAFMADTGQNATDKILTGHYEGLITINIIEANDVEREMSRQSMHEDYRTLLGHFRHEIAHYYWDKLINNTKDLEGYRHFFGDEQLDYSTALKAYYANGAKINWNDNFISAYASSHPWEDWAETWAHYMHIMDTLETAASFGISIKPTEFKSFVFKQQQSPYNVQYFEAIIKAWLPFTFTMNCINRSMGLNDIYPFTITPFVQEKLLFIHQIVTKR